jgi:5-deoxy-5-amino-3-dehydroquinate synthase
VRRVAVEVLPRPYDVVVGDGARHSLAAEIARVAPDAAACAIVTQQPLIDAGWLDGLSSGIDQRVVTIPTGEDAKSLATTERLCRDLVEMGISRRDLVVAFGGGLVSDVAGFAASIYHRGIRYLTVATTLLAQVDAAIGGKTGVNLPEGKNLVGSFWQPLGVLCDTEVLRSLPSEEWACGRGEMAKYAFLGDARPSAEILELALVDQVALCVSVKAAVVAADEREGGLRMILNYGHTLGHALEAVGLEERARGARSRAAELRHGEAVALGIVFAAMLARRLGRIDDERVRLHLDVVTGFDLAATLPEGLDAHALLAAMRRDKKAHHDLTFVLDGPAGVEPVSGVDAEAVLATLSEMGAKP